MNHIELDDYLYNIIVTIELFIFYFFTFIYFLSFFCMSYFVLPYLYNLSESNLIIISISDILNHPPSIMKINKDSQQQKN